MSEATVEASAIRKVLVVGAGTMGQGIAQISALAGYVTHLHDVDPARVDKAIGVIKTLTDRLVQKGKMLNEARSEMIGMLVPSPDLGPAAADVDLVIEAAPESMDLKVEVLGRIKLFAPERAILGSNTSSLSITELGHRTGAGARTIGLHFFNPPPVMELLEIVRGVATSDESLERALAVARAADIDKGMELGYRHPMGPLKLTDLVGLDVRLAILEHLTREIGDQFRPPPILRAMVRAGKLGKKTGEGFYRWENGVAVPK